MTRISKKAQRRAVSPRKHHVALRKSNNSKKENTSGGYRSHENAVEGNQSVFIAKVK